MREDWVGGMGSNRRCLGTRPVNADPADFGGTKPPLPVAEECGHERIRQSWPVHTAQLPAGCADGKGRSGSGAELRLVLPSRLCAANQNRLVLAQKFFQGRLAQQQGGSPLDAWLEVLVMHQCPANQSDFDVCISHLPRLARGNRFWRNIFLLLHAFDDREVIRRFHSYNDRVMQLRPALCNPPGGFRTIT